MANDLGSAIRDEILKLLGPLTSAASVDGGTAALVQAIGHVGALGNDPQLQAEVERLATLAEGIAALDARAFGSWQGVLQVLSLARDLMASVGAVESTITDPTLARRAQHLGTELAEQLFALYLRSHHPHFFRAAAALTLITPAEQASPEPMVAENGTVSRLPWPRDRVHFDRVSSFLGDPLGTLEAAYLPGGMAQAQEAHLAADRLFPLLRDLSRSLQLGWLADRERVAPPPLASPDPEGNLDDLGHDHEDAALEQPDPGPVDISSFQRDYRPRLGVFLPGEDGDASRLGLIVTASSAEHPDGIQGFVLSPAGEVGWSETRGAWRLELSAGGAIPAFVVGPGGVALAPLETPLTGGTAALAIERVPDQGAPAFRLGAADGTRIEIGGFRFRVDLALSAARQALSLSAEADSGALVLAPGDGDGFLRAMLPPGGARVAFDLGLVLSSDRGLELKGGAGLDLVLKPNLTLGPVAVPYLQLALEADDGEVRFKATGALAARLGPVAIVVEGFGVRLAASAPPTGGSFGPVDLDAGFQPPTGAAISIDAPTVTGGGYLFFDAEKEQYAGAVLLQFEKITLNAVGLLTTRMPDGSDGFSLLLMLAAEDFPPVDLGLGFRLTGIGGLLGFNRSVAVDVLRAGLKNKTLDSVLFPEDPIRNAPTIVSNLRRVFPATPGQHCIGPVAQLTWGTNDLLAFDVGLVIEFPNPVRLIILGQMRALLPSREKALIKLNMDLFGAIDFDRGEALVLATLYDSKLLAWNISGDAAFYARWEQDPVFILSAGGFHPAFPAPPELPPLDRLAMVLSKGDSVRLTMTWYLALTSNTFQHGSHISLVVKGGGFSVDGHLGYDTLVQFDPFGFVISFSAGVGLKWHGHTLASVQLDGTLSGPSPWHVEGKATFKIWKFSKSVSFDKTLGEAAALPPMPVVDPRPALLEALANPVNWTAALPPRQEMLVSLRDTPVDGAVRVHPLGSVAVRQQVLPLDVPIEKFGNARVRGTPSYRIDAVTFNGQPSPPRVALEDHFAPGQFQELSEGERLSRPSFEKMKAGTRVETDALTYGGSSAADAAHRRSTTLAYETAIIMDDAETGEAVAVTQPGLYTPDAARLDAQVPFGAAARSPMRRTGKGRFAPPEIESAKTEKVKVQDTPYVVARREDLAVVSIDVSGDGDMGGRGVEDESQNYSATLSRLQAYARLHPEDAGNLQVVPFYEVEDLVAS